jgi:hypothetical protein
MVTPRRKKIALVIAALADAVQLAFIPVFGGGALSIPDDALDLAVAVALVLALGWQWRIAVALAIELVPGVALFPSWTAFVATLPAMTVAPALAVGDETSRRLDRIDEEGDTKKV